MKARKETAWLDALEEKIGQAAERLRSLGKENDRLRRRVEELEGRLAEAEGAAEWAGERDEIRQRVERLAQGLEKLLS